MVIANGMEKCLFVGTVNMTIPAKEGILNTVLETVVQRDINTFVVKQVIALFKGKAQL